MDERKERNEFSGKQLKETGNEMSVVADLHSRYNFLHDLERGLRSFINGMRVNAERFIYYCSHSLKRVLEDYPVHPDQYVYIFKTTVNGKNRKIVTYRPTGEGESLRQLHRMLVMMLQGYYESASCSYAYKEGYSVNSCLNNHLKSDVFLKSDIHAYFDTISFELLLDRFLKIKPGFLRRKGFWKKVLRCCFYDCRLPIGFVSSPMLSDIYLNDVDRLFGEKKRIHYTRYADDFILSASGDKAEELLGRTLEQLKDELAKLGLETNTRKTYIRRLRLEGDAIHLLGLNLVRKKKGLNRITVSNRYLVQISKDFGLLLKYGNKLESWELQDNFVALCGKISYVLQSSSDSTDKLKKMIRVKTGYDGDLTYRALENVIRPDTEQIRKKFQKRQMDIFAGTQGIRIIPEKGRVWEKCSLPANDYGLKTLHCHLLAICREFESGNSNRLKINRLSLTVGENQYSYTAPWNTEKFRADIKDLAKGEKPVQYSADYCYDNHSDARFEKKGNGYLPKNGFRPFLCYYETTGTNLLYDEGTGKWLMTQKVVDSSPVHDLRLLKKSELGVIQFRPSWQGTLCIDLRWRFQTDEESLKRIELVCSDLTERLKEYDIQYDRNSRCLLGSFKFVMDRDLLMEVVSLLQDAVSLVRLTDGIVKIDGWCIPSDFLKTKRESMLNFVRIYATDKKLTLYSFEG